MDSSFATREKLALACKLLYMEGLIDHGGLVGARVPGDGGLVLNPREMRGTEGRHPGLMEADDMVIVDGAVTPTPTTFRLTTATSTTTPLVGQTIGFYDASVQLFQRKRIGTVAVVVAGKSWDITADTSNAASDTSYTPFVGQVASPYSGSLDALAPAIISYFDGLGPGEQVASFPDPCRRQRRQPSSPTTWPSTINSKLIAPILAVAAIENATVLLPANPFSTTVGTPGIQSFLITLGDLCAFV